MAYKSKARRVEKDLREALPGGGRLPVGRSHRVQIVEVTPRSDDSSRITFRDAFDNEHIENIFYLNREREDVSGLMKQLISAQGNCSEDVISSYESIRNGQGLPNEVSTWFLIETEYRGNFINIKTIRSVDDRDSDGSQVQSTEADPTQKGEAVDTRKQSRYLAISKEVNSFF